MNDLEAWDRTCFGHTAQAEVLHIQAAAGAEMTQLTPGICSKILALEQVRTGVLTIELHVVTGHDEYAETVVGPMQHSVEHWLATLASAVS